MQIILLGEMGPFLGTGAKAGPVGALDLRRDAIKALVEFVPKAPVANIEKDEWGVFMKLTEHRSVGSYHALNMVKERSLNPITVGSNLHIDLDDLQDVILGFIN